MTDPHFDYFVFYDRVLIVLCGPGDVIWGFVVLNGNELKQLYVKPKYRGHNTMKRLIWEAMSICNKAGYTQIWGLCYDRTLRVYRQYAKSVNVPLEIWPPSSRVDGQWTIIWNVDNDTMNRRPVYK